MESCIETRFGKRHSGIDAVPCEQEAAVSDVAADCHTRFSLEQPHHIVFAQVK